VYGVWSLATKGKRSGTFEDLTCYAHPLSSMFRNEAEVEEFERVQVQMLFECLRPATIIKPYNHLSFAFWCMIRKAGHR